MDIQELHDILLFTIEHARDIQNKDIPNVSYVYEILKSFDDFLGINLKMEEMIDGERNDESGSGNSIRK